MIRVRFSRLFLILLGVVTGSFITQVAADNLAWLAPLFHRPALAFATLFPG